MRLCDCAVNDIFKWRSGGSLWRVIYKGDARFSSRQEIRCQNLNGQFRKYSEYDAEYQQHVINLTKSGVTVPVEGTRFEFDW